MSVNTSSWTDQQLEKLCDPSNHKVISDGYEWIWMNKIAGKWELHSIKLFEESSKAYSWLQWNLDVWAKELLSRRKKQAAKARRIDRKIRRIIEQHDYETNKKVLEIHKLNPELTMKEIGLMVGISKSTVTRWVADVA